MFCARFWFKLFLKGKHALPKGFFFSVTTMKPVKRLRGTDLEVAKQIPETLTKGKGEGSKGGLSELLLSLWSHGQLSAKLVQEVAHKAILDGAQGQDLQRIAATGSFGAQGGNVHRDMRAQFLKDCRISKGISVETECQDPKTSKPCLDMAGVMLPHLLFSDMFNHYPDQFDKIFGVEDLDSFRRGVEYVSDDRFMAHPICLDKRTGVAKGKVQDKSLTIPLFLHADGVEYQQRDSFLVWNWGGFLNAYSSLTSHFLIAGFPKSCTIHDKTWKPLMDWILWSFEALQDGVHPSYGPDNGPLPKGSVFEKLAGQPLTQRGFRCCIWSVQGDQEMFSNILSLPHWNNYSPCHECDCMQPMIKKEPCPAGKSFKLLLANDQNYEYIDTPAALTKGHAHPLFNIPGLTTRMVRQDGLHVLFCKGVCNHLLGSLLHHLCYFQGKGKQTKKPGDRLALIFNQVQENYRLLGSSTRLTNLKLSMICDPRQPHKEYPKLDCKGAETKHLLAAFLPVLKAMLDADDALHQHMVGALQSMVGLVNLIDRADMFPTQEEHLEALNLDKRFCEHYWGLNQWAQENDRKLYHIVWKFHAMHHLIKNFQFLNPKYTWNFRAEDFVGRVSRLGSSIAMGVKSTRLSAKLLVKYRILLHMQLTRLGFEIGAVTPDSDLEY